MWWFLMGCWSSHKWQRQKMIKLRLPRSFTAEWMVQCLSLQWQHGKQNLCENKISQLHLIKSKCKMTVTDGWKTYFNNQKKCADCIVDCFCLNWLRKGQSMIDVGFCKEQNCTSKKKQEMLEWEKPTSWERSHSHVKICHWKRHRNIPFCCFLGKSLTMMTMPHLTTNFLNCDGVFVMLCNGVTGNVNKNISFVNASSNQVHLGILEQEN